MLDINFTPVEADIPIDKGIVQFTIEKAESKQIENKDAVNFGAQMLVVHLLLKDKKGNQKKKKHNFIIKDEYLRNLAYFCQAIGVYEKYKTGNLKEPDLVGKVGRCEIDYEDKTIDGNEVKVVEIKKFLKLKA
ncbi:hypothetical protein [Cysteiniphilum marinum]|uniref:hypothetical protein n=1 Tax=Cysteiniphilum marinum TaxID=2774191 RepID=UPI00193A4CEB|nr:hypothetical protein [Cysteiniphilum marinum]